MTWVSIKLDWTDEISKILKRAYISNHQRYLFSILWLKWTLFQNFTSLSLIHSEIYAVNPFMPTVPTFAVRETWVSQTANVGTWLRKRNGGQKWVNRKYITCVCCPWVSVPCLRQSSAWAACAMAREEEARLRCSESGGGKEGKILNIWKKIKVKFLYLWEK